MNSIWTIFSFHHSPEETFNGKFVDLFGPPRDPKALFFTPDTGYPSYFGDKPANYNQLGKENQHYADIAASIQTVTEEVLLDMARQIHKEFGVKRLCMAGGVALNSVANGRIVRETPIEELYIQPSAGDGGGADWGGTLCLSHCFGQATAIRNGTRLLGARA